MPSLPSAVRPAAPMFSAEPRFRGPRHRLLGWLSLLATVVVFLPWLIEVPGLLAGEGLQLRYSLDYEVYRVGAAALAAGEPLYAGGFELAERSLPFTYPPFAALVFQPLTWLPLLAGTALFNAGSVLALWWCLVLVLRTLFPHWHPSDPRRLALYLLPGLLVLGPVQTTLALGQVNIWLMLLVLLDTLGRSTRVPRGFWIGIAAAIKLTPAVFGLYLLIRKDYRGAATAVGTALGVSALAWLLSPENSREYWLATLSEADRIGNLHYASNQSWQGALARLLPESAITAVWLLLVGITIAVITLVMWRAQRAGASAAGLVSLNAGIALLCSPVSWSHHWVWLIPLAMVLIAGSRPHRRNGWLAAALLLAMLLRPHWLLPNGADQELAWSWYQHLPGNSYPLLFLAVMLAVLWRPGLLNAPAPPATPPLAGAAASEDRGSPSQDARFSEAGRETTGPRTSAPETGRP